MAIDIRFKRGTKSQINTAATANQLAEGQPYLITDENRIAVGLSASTYEEFAKKSEVGLTATTTSTVTLTAAGWSANSQTLTVTGVTASSVNYFVFDTIVMMTRWGEAKVLATSQGTNSITFICDTTPTENIEFKVVILK